MESISNIYIYINNNMRDAISTPRRTQYKYCLFGREMSYLSAVFCLIYNVVISWQDRI